MKTTYSDESGSAYIYLKSPKSAAFYSVEEELTNYSPTDVNIDIDEAGEVIGIELLGVKYLAEQFINPSKLKTTYDKDHSLAYIYLKPPGTKSHKTVEAEMPDYSSTDVNIDIDQAGEVIGIELIGVKYLKEALTGSS